MTDNHRDMTEHRITKLEGRMQGLTDLIGLRLDTLDQKSDARHAALMEELRETRDLAQAAQGMARQNQVTLDRVFWLIRQARHLYWMAPAAGAVWMWSQGVITWDQMKAVLKNLGS